jgi:hypothetical protein
VYPKDTASFKDDLISELRIAGERSKNVRRPTASHATPDSPDKSCTPPLTTNLPVPEKQALEQTPKTDVLEKRHATRRRIEPLNRARVALHSKPFLNIFLEPFLLIKQHLAGYSRCANRVST